MYSPKFNSVLVEIDDKDGEWGGENSEAMLGKSYSKGTVVSVAIIIPVDKHPMTEAGADEIAKDIHKLISKQIMWNEGAEAGTTFEDGGKLYGMIYWWDVRGAKDVG